MDKYYIDVLKNKYMDFDGRASRKDYWMFVLFNLIASIVVGIVGSVVGLNLPNHNNVLSSLYGLAVLLPSLAIAVRRLHDTGRSAWNLLWSLLPIIGWIVLFVFYVMDSQPGANQYGPNPKGV